MSDERQFNIEIAERFNDMLGKISVRYYMVNGRGWHDAGQAAAIELG